MSIIPKPTLLFPLRCVQCVLLGVGRSGAWPPRATNALCPCVRVEQELSGREQSGLCVFRLHLMAFSSASCGVTMSFPLLGLMLQHVHEMLEGRTGCSIAAVLLVQRSSMGHLPQQGIALSWATVWDGGFSLQRFLEVSSDRCWPGETQGEGTWPHYG